MLSLSWNEAVYALQDSVGLQVIFLQKLQVHLVFDMPWAFLECFSKIVLLGL